MDKTTTERIALVFMFIAALLIVCGLFLIAWGFVELIQWITSK